MPEVLSEMPAAVRGKIRRTTTGDGTGLAYRYWDEPGARDAAVYLHGIAGHSLWFSAAAARLARAGIAVYAPDRRGSGLNVELGAGHIPHHRAVLNDVSHFVELARSEHSGGKLFLLAGCWGAKAGVTFAAQQGQRLDGLALIAPALSVRVKLPPLTLAGVVLSLLTQPRRHFRIPLEPEQYTNNRRFQAFVAGDQQRLLSATARFYLETARLDRLATSAPRRIRLPVLLLLGGQDAIVNVAGTRAWFERLASPDKTMKLYPDFAHILEFEDQWETYLNDLLSWLHAHGSVAAVNRSAE